MNPLVFDASWLVQTLIRGLGWLLLLLLLALVLRRTSAARRALLWQMGFVGLILLPLLLRFLPPLLLKSRTLSPLSTVLTIQPEPAITPSLPPVPAPPAPPAPSLPRPPATPLLPGHPPAMPPAPVSEPPVPTVPPAASHIHFTQIIFWGWGLGVLWSLLRLLLSLSALRRLGWNAVLPSPELREAQRQAAARLGLRRNVMLYIAASDSPLQAPVTWGIFRPRVLLPSDTLHADAAKRHTALLHELAHIQRGDWAWRILAQGVCALYWCVPLVWLAARQLSCETELACDDCVLRAGIFAPDYAAQILEVARLMNSRKTDLPLSALTMARPPLAQTRIEAILAPYRRRQPITRWGMLGALLLLLLAVPALSLRAIAALEEPKPLPPTPLPAETALPLPAPMEDPPATRRAETSTGGPPSTPAGPALRAIHPGSAPSENLQAAAPPQPGVGAAPLPAGKAPEMQTLAWGPVVDGLQTGLRLVTPKTSYAPGETIEQEVYLRNRTKSDVFVTASGGYEEQGAPVVTDAKGGKVKVLNFYGEGLYYMVSTRVRAGEMGLVGRFTLAFRAPEKGEDSPKEVAPGLSSWAEGMPLALARTGTYVLRQDIIPMGADEKTPKKTVPTGSIPIRIAGKPAAIIPVDHNRIADLATAPITWGPERSGLQAGLLYVGQKSRYYVGERVRLAVVLRNVSAHPISFWHETSFASLEPPNVLDAAGKKIAVPFAAEPEWRTLGEIRMSGVTFDMTYAPSADGPSRLRQSEIKPGQSVIGYYLTAFVIPPKWSGGLASPGRYRVVQPIRLGLGDAEQLDTTLETGNLDLEIYDPDAKQ